MDKDPLGGEGVRNGIWDMVRRELEAKGIDLERLCGGADDACRAKIVCVAPDLGESVREMERSPRGRTVMARLDADTVKTLDAWVETGWVKSRSAAAALFIREGLKVRASELEQLNDALKQVQSARQRLQEKARQVFGEDASGGES